MGKTMQGAFEMTYHHIDAPTIQDEEYKKEFKKYKLVIPDDSQGNAYRSSLLEYLADSPWVYTRKIDGANLRVQWNGEQALWNGKSDKFQCSADLTDYMNRTFLEEIFEEKFGRDKVVTLFGEHMGPKVQGNELGLERDEFVLYDANVNGTWLSGESIVEIAEYFNIRTVYDFMPNEVKPTRSLRELIIDCAGGAFSEWEGIVATPLIEMRDQAGNRVIVKIKNRDYQR